MLGAFWLQVFIRPIYNLLVLAYLPFKDLGVAIILVTFLIRLLLFPLFSKQIRSQKEMSELQKDLQKIKERFKDDPKKIQEETLKLYQSRGVNPLGGCLPTLIQIPIFIALYQVFRFYLGVDHVDLLYSFVPQIKNITLVAFGFIHLDKPDFYILPYLVGITQYFLSKLMGRQQQVQAKKKSKDKQTAIEEQMQMMNRSMLYFMPLFLVVISFSLPAAVVLYFLTSNLFSLLQYYFFYKKTPAVKIKTKNG